MVVLHIACIRDNPFSGVCNIVPKHLKAQSEYATVGLININNERIGGSLKQLLYEKKFDIKRIPKPFCSPDIVVIHEVYHKEYLKIAKNLKKNDIPYIIVPHGSLTKYAQGKKRLKKFVANKVFFDKFVNGSRALQCLSDNEMQQTKFKKEKFVGTNGTDRVEKKKERFSLNAKKIVYIGRLDFYHKGLDLMFEAIKNSKKFLFDNNCKIYIYGPDYKNRRSVVSNLIDANDVRDIVCLMNEVSGYEKEKVLLDADIFIQTSRFEGMPLGILEALSYGLPCLVTEGTNMGDIIKKYNAGWVAKTDVLSISKKLEEAVGDIEPEVKSSNATEVIKKEFDWDIVSKKAINDYKNFIKTAN